MPKVRKQRPSVLDRVPRTDDEPYAHKPAAPRKGPDTKKSVSKKPVNRRIRQTSDLNAPAMQKKSDRNRGRG
jgi:23S rRNA pseudouridine2605 synthase